MTQKQFGEVEVNQEFASKEGTPYKKLELQQLPRYGWVNAVATTEAGKYYAEDTGHRYFYDDTTVTVSQ